MNCWKVKKLQAQNFRNLHSDVFDFVPGINCVFGQNGNGKTNLLEAIYLLTNKKSFRKNTGYSQIINIEGASPELILQSVFENNGDLASYSLRMSEGNEERFLNNVFEKSKTPTTLRYLSIHLTRTHFYTSSTFRKTVDGFSSVSDG